MLEILRLLVSLGVVLTLLVMLARWAKRRGIGGVAAAGSGHEVELLSRRALGRGTAVHVVRVGEQVLVLGVTDQQVSLLRELVPAAVPAAATDRPEDPEQPEEPRGPLTPPTDFAAVLAARFDDEAAAPSLTLVQPATRAERRALERTRSHRGHHARGVRTGPTAGRLPHPSTIPLERRGAAPAEVPAGWPWNAASVVVGALKGGRA